VLSVAVVFALGGKCSKYLSNTARAIMNRVMGPIPVALVAQMIIDGLKVLLSGLAGS
jgi:small neutral amino acid transporter SnatA (MarC family)